MARVKQSIAHDKEEDEVETPSSNYAYEKQRQEESRLIKGIFQDNEVKGGSVKFPFKKFRGDKIVMYEFKDGEEYEIPLAVVKHLNSNCGYDVYSNVIDSYGRPTPTGKKIHRFSFKVSEYT